MKRGDEERKNINGLHVCHVHLCRFVYKCDCYNWMCCLMAVERTSSSWSVSHISLSLVLLVSSSHCLTRCAWHPLTHFVTVMDVNNSSEYIATQLGPQRSLPLHWMIPLTSMYAIVFFMGAIGNLLVVIVILKFRFMRENMTNLYLCNLAITDLLSLSAGECSPCDRRKHFLSQMSSTRDDKKFNRTHSAQHIKVTLKTCKREREHLPSYGEWRTTGVERERERYIIWQEWMKWLFSLSLQDRQNQWTQ